LFRVNVNREFHVNHPMRTATHSRQQAESRAAERTPLTLPARLTWKDQRGATRFASVTVRNLSETGVYIESPSALAIPLYRLVQFQLERTDRMSAQVPPALRDTRILSAVYRNDAAAPGRPQGLALRLLIDPKRLASHDAAPRRASA
jgi:hypothetical protein